MATDLDPHYSLLDELDARQDELLGQLEQLNQRIELLLGQFGAAPIRPDSTPLMVQS